MSSKQTILQGESLTSDIEFFCITTTVPLATGDPLNPQDPSGVDNLHVINFFISNRSQPIIRGVEEIDGLYYYSFGLEHKDAWVLGGGDVNDLVQEINGLHMPTGSIISTIPGVGNTSIEKSENLYPKLSGGSSVDCTYSGTSTLDVGGITVGETFVDANLQVMMESLLEKEFYPTLTNPSATIHNSATTYEEVGRVISILEFTSSFNRGSISPAYGTTGYRSGLPNTYNYTGYTIGGSVPSTSLVNTQQISNYTVLPGPQNWTVSVAYDQGEQPKTSIGNDYGTPLPAGATGNINSGFTGVYAAFATTAVISQTTIQPLQSMDSNITVDMVAEDDLGNKQSIEFPNDWKTITTVEQFNTFTGSWDFIDLASFSTAPIDKSIHGNMVMYTKFTHNGPKYGARTLRWS